MNPFRFSLLTCFLVFLLPLCAAAQESTAPNPAQNTINLPPDTAVITRLVAKFDSTRLQQGDRVEARITHDVKDGRQIVLPKGALVVGQVSHFVAPPPGTLYGVVINFDTVELKNGTTASLHLEIQAIAPAPVVAVNAITDQPYNGANRVRADEHGVEVLTATSKGVFNLPDVILGLEVSSKGRTSIITSPNKIIRLDKDSQIVFRVLNPVANAAPPP
jgi:hypothetical protein